MLHVLCPSKGSAAIPGVCGAEPSAPHPMERIQHHQGKEKPVKPQGGTSPAGVDQCSSPRIMDPLRQDLSQQRHGFVSLFVNFPQISDEFSDQEGRQRCSCTLQCWIPGRGDGQPLFKQKHALWAGHAEPCRCQGSPPPWPCRLPAPSSPLSLLDRRIQLWGLEEESKAQPQILGLLMSWWEGQDWEWLCRV